jgi:diguanylate cyclase (GGDEF)-like protein
MNTQNLEHDINVSVLHSLIHNSYLALFASFISTIVLFFLAQNHVQTDHLILWFLISLLIFIGRLSLLWFYQKKHFLTLFSFSIKQLLLSNILITSILMGLFLLLFFKSLDEGPQLFVMLIIAGLVVGSVSTYAMSKEAFYLYFFPVVIPLLIASFLYKITNYPFLELIIVVFFSIMIIAFHKIHSTYMRALLKEFENKTLVQELETSNDILKQKQVQLHQQAYYDHLTTLPNRAHFYALLEDAIDRSLNTQSQNALLFLDIDNFKQINDSLGHIVGDDVLQKIAELFKQWLPSHIYVARLGGDEFVVLIQEYHYENEVAKIASQLLRISHKPLTIDGHQLYVSISIGISTFPEHGKTREDVLRNSDSALYKAKEHGKNNYAFYDEAMTKKALEHLTIEAKLNQALTHDHLQLYFQPQLHATTNEVLGFEVLLRWYDEQLGWVSPADFIPIAEETSLILNVDQWVLEQSFKQIQEWNNDGVNFKRIAINISAQKLQSEGFTRTVEALLLHYNVKPNQIEFELTERYLLHDHNHAINTLTHLHGIGITLSIDDFGTGYSSLAYLQKLPLNKLKIDRAFVQDLDTNPDDEVIVTTIIALAHNLKLSVLAEGVENEKQQNILIKNHCENIQGFYFSKPLNTSDTTQFIRKRANDTTNL